MASVFELAKSTLAKALGPSGPSLPFSIGDPLPNQDYDSIWRLHRGTKKDDGTLVTVFIFDMNQRSDKQVLARNALKRARTIRHPHFLKFIEGIETETQIIIGTEPVQHLSAKLRESSNPNFLCWGLYKIATVMKFLNKDCQMVHGNLRIGSIYTTLSGEWKLGGFETLGSLKEEQNVFVNYANRVPNLGRYLSLEVIRGQARTVTPSAVDGYAFGCLIHEVFNGAFSRAEDLGQRGSIPTNLYEQFKAFLLPDASRRLSFDAFLEIACRTGGYFDNDMIWTSSFLEEINMKDAHEKDQFMRKIDVSLGDFPPEFLKHKVLPELLKAVEFGGAGAKALTPILKIGGKLTQDEFNTLILPSIISLFASQDRAIRYSLCENLEGFVKFIPDKVVNDKIFPSLATGFSDVNASIREQTLKAILPMAPKLNERNMNTELLRFLSKLQTDDQPGIRTNTAICIGKISKYLNNNSQKRILSGAFIQSCCDPFPPARNAGLLAFAATLDYYDPTDISAKCIPMFSRLLLDPNKGVRTQAFKNMNAFLKKMEQHAETIPEEKKETTSLGSTPSLAPGSQAGAGWADWALSTMSSKISGMHVESTKSEPGAVSRHEQNRVDPAKIQPGNVMKPSPNSGSSSTFMPTASMSHSVLQPTKTSSNPDVGQTSTNGMASKPMKLSSPAFPAYVNNVVKPDWDADGWGNDLIDFDDAAGGWSGSVAAKPIATKSDSASFGASNTTPALAESNGWGDESDMDWGAWSTPADAASKKGPPKF